ncbi:LURP-one-related family protein [Clostridium sp. AN503]|uniref:LURP-one-related/scramblase family protein n=1 Tax=Clostridium sp. AN503 TaxID=3160598 RepID=UPI003458B2C3
MVYTITGKILTMHRTMEVTDANEALFYKATSKAISITDKSRIEDAEGNLVAEFHRKVMSIHAVHYIEMADGTKMTMKSELFHPFHQVIDVEEKNWKIKGNFASHEYQILDADGGVLAEVRRPWLSIHDKCELNVVDEGQEKELLALTIVLEHMLIDERVAAESTAAAGAGTAAGAAAAENSDGGQQA